MLFVFPARSQRGLDAVVRLSPFSNIETGKLIVRVRDTIYATIFGTLAVPCCRALGGAMFWWLGFPSPALLGLDAVISIIPVLGSFVIWIPATIYLALEDRGGRRRYARHWARRDLDGGQCRASAARRRNLAPAYGAGPHRHAADCSSFWPVGSFSDRRLHHDLCSCSNSGGAARTPTCRRNKLRRRGDEACERVVERCIRRSTTAAFA